MISDLGLCNRSDFKKMVETTIQCQAKQSYQFTVAVIINAAEDLDTQ